MEIITQEKKDGLKGDSKAYSESASETLTESKKNIFELRANNAKLRNVLRERLTADHHIINHVMQNRQSDKVCFANKTGADVLEIMDYRTCDAIKQLNSLKHKTLQKENKFEDLKTEYRDLSLKIQESNETWSGTNKEGKKLRDLENRLNKAQLKHHEAEHIQKTYEQIKQSLQDEYLTYEQTLDTLEKQIKSTQKEISELQIMYNDAIIARDSAQQELWNQEKHVTSKKIYRELELHNMKQSVSGRRLINEKSDNQLPEEISERDNAKTDDSMLNNNNTSDKSFDETNPGISVDQQAIIASYEESFKQIKEATGLSDLDQIVKRFESQSNTLNNLNSLKEKAQNQCHQLRKERDNYQLVYEKMKYSGETELVSANQLLEQYRAEANDEVKRRETLTKYADETSHLLIECKTGVDHIYQKLNFLNVDATYGTADGSFNRTEEQLPEMLKQCNNKLDKLMVSLNEMDIDEQLNLMQQEEVREFFTRLEGKIPEFNTRIQIPMTQVGISDEDEDPAGDENEFLTRDTLKKQAEQILEMRHKKRQTKKKKKSR